jgi:hypothetical protein
MLRFTFKAIQKSDGKNREAFSPTFKPGKYSQVSIHKVLDPSAEELNPPGGKKGVLVNTATPHMGVHEHILRKGKNSNDTRRFSVYLKKTKKFVKKNIVRNNRCIENKLKMRQRVSHNF